MKTFIASIAIVSIAGMGVFVGAGAADEAGVSATVTVQNIAVLVSDGVVEYGILAAGASEDTVNLGDLQTATNDGNVSATLNIKGSDSAPWTLAGAAGVDEYKHEFSTDSFTGATALTTSYQTLATSVAALDTQTFDLRITTPTTSTSFVAQAVNVTVQATL